MNTTKKFLSFLESLKTKQNSALIESVKHGFLLMEGTNIQLPSIEVAVDGIISQLSPEELKYATDNNGFSSLHDLMDANTLLPTDASTPQDIEYLNSVVSAFNKKILG